MPSSFLSLQVVEGLGSTRARLRQELHPAVARGLSEVTAAALGSQFISWAIEGM